MCVIRSNPDTVKLKPTEVVDETENCTNLSCLLELNQHSSSALLTVPLCHTLTWSQTPSFFSLPSIQKKVLLLLQSLSRRTRHLYVTSGFAPTPGPSSFPGPHYSI